MSLIYGTSNIEIALSINFGKLKKLLIILDEPTTSFRRGKKRCQTNKLKEKAVSLSIFLIVKETPNHVRVYVLRTAKMLMFLKMM